MLVAPIPGPLRTPEGSASTGRTGKLPLRVFLSYPREDAARVDAIYQRLKNEGLKPWIDRKDILPGEKWEQSIREAIRQSDFVLVCLSGYSVNKRCLQKEIKYSLDISDEMLDSDIYVIPVRLDNCDVPEKLRTFQWMDLFEPDGWARLLEALGEGADGEIGEIASGKRSRTGSTQDNLGQGAGTPSCSGTVNGRQA